MGDVVSGGGPMPEGPERDGGAAEGAPATPETAAAAAAVSADRSGEMPAVGPDGRRVPPLGRAIAVYSGIRIGLLVVLTLLLELAGRPFGMPLIVAVAFAVVLQLPIAVLLFSRQRHDLTAALARSKSRRTRERDRLRSELTGREPLD